MKYFDYAATTPVDKEILATYVKVSEKYFAHSGVNPEVEQLENESKKIILEKLNFNVNDYQIIYTSGGSEANNLAIKGYAQKYNSKRHFITSVYEHSSMHESFKYIEEQGHEVTFLNPNKEGIITPESVMAAIRPNTVLISIMHVNNEIGTVNPIAEIGKSIKGVDKKIVFMVDSVQGVGKTKLLDNTNIDMMSASAHKIYGPKGIGALIKRKDIELNKQIHGGALEFGFRGGTQNLAAQVSFAKAVKEMIDNREFVLSQIEKRREFLVSELLKNPKVTLNAPSISNVISIRVAMEMKSESVVALLLERGFAISTKSACSSKLNKGSRTLNSIGLTMEEQDHTFRISVSHFTPLEDIKELIENFNEVINTND